MTVTKAGQDKLRSERPTPNLDLNYTIDNAGVKAAVHSSTDAERIGLINQGDRTLQQASDALNDNYALRSLEGSAKAHFQQSPQRPETLEPQPPIQQEPQPPQVLEPQRPELPRWVQPTKERTR